MRTEREQMENERELDRLGYGSARKSRCRCTGLFEPFWGHRNDMSLSWVGGATILRGDVEIV